MPSPRLRFLLVVLVLAACAGGESSLRAPEIAQVEPPPEPSASSAPVSSMKPLPPAPPSPCGDMRERNQTLLEESNAGEAYRPAGEQAFESACFPTPSGAWGLKLLEWKPAPDAGEPPTLWQGTFELIHFAGVQEVRAPDSKDLHELFSLKVGMDYFELKKPVLFDYDGDGEPEIFLANSIKIHEDIGYTKAGLFSWKAGKVALYPELPAGYDDIEDIDQDGRPDLLYHPLQSDREAPCSGFGYRWSGPPHAAHSLKDGTFSTQDKPAQNFLRRACPAPPSPPKKSAKPTEFLTAEDNPPEVCARIWGASEKAALDLLKRTCDRPKKPEHECQPPPGTCPDYKEREATAKKTPPLLLKK